MHGARPTLMGRALSKEKKRFSFPKKNKKCDSYVYMWHAMWKFCVCHMSHMCVSHDSCVRVTWLVCVCHMTHMCVSRDVNVCYMTHMCVLHDSCVCVAWRKCVCHMTHTCVSHDSWGQRNNARVRSHDPKKGGQNVQKRTRGKQKHTEHTNRFE